MVHLAFAQIGVVIVAGFIFSMMPVDWEKGCATYNIYDERDGVVNRLSDGSSDIIQVKTGDCQEPVHDGVWLNLLVHEPGLLFAGMVPIALALLYLLIFPGRILFGYMMGQYRT